MNGVHIAHKGDPRGGNRATELPLNLPDTPAHTVYEIIYSSLATHDLSPEELTALLDHARQANQARGVTGMMIYRKREFLQLLEGEQAVVQALYQRIAQDDRHQQMAKLWDGPIQARSFGEWEMAFVAPDDPTLQAHEGYRDLLDRGLIAAGRGSTGKQLLISLRDDFLGGR